MNKRQAKKQYKKIHGHNPPKTAVTKYTPEEMEAMKVYNLTPEDIERIGNGLRDAFAEMFKTLQRVAESMARAFEDMGKKYSRPVIETEEPPVVVARTLSERRKHTVEEWGKALEEFAEYQCQQDKEERTWQDHIMDRFMRRI